MNNQPELIDLRYLEDIRELRKLADSKNLARIFDAVSELESQRN